MWWSYRYPQCHVVTGSVQPGEDGKTAGPVDPVDRLLADSPVPTIRPIARGGAKPRRQDRRRATAWRATDRPGQPALRVGRPWPVESRQCVSVAFTAELIDAGIAGSIGAIGDALDNALCESTIGLFKTEASDPHSDVQLGV